MPIDIRLLFIACVCDFVGFTAARSEENLYFVQQCLNVRTVQTANSKKNASFEIVPKEFATPARPAGSK